MFSHQRKLMVFHWRLSDSKFPQVSRTLFSILTVFDNAVVWMVSTRSPTSKSSRLFNNRLVTVPKAPITIGIIVSFIFHSFFFQFSIKVEVSISLFTFFQFYSVVSRDSKIENFADFLFVDYYKLWSSGRDEVIRIIIVIIIIVIIVICTKQNSISRIKHKMFWDFDIQTDYLILAKRPNFVIFKKKGE